ncbi:TetR/AcrR family transcriptional regulator [Roseibium denhamense]|uniref:Transcriptional regulator, TetR family n=1 Tax=Roseibium denhamense TaxID=76305 RepID=A0ABY1PHM2_9HYPH|nr:TetR/AcrR family transcriptional regulator [Roseibium denhamense]MTI04762.1 TetR/AcrR family transcriptional regulator [Roseibium denhamense]SMP33474.1 transcriptional regulator, TetR family [Roseibium denhamense]
MNSRNARSTRGSKSEILDAALDLIRREGAARLTIDAVAEAAGFSKGGVLYNFPTKDVLITGMVEHLAGQFEEAVAAARASNLSSDCPTLSAMIDVTEGWLRERRDVAQAILAIKVNQPELSEPFVAVKKRLKSAIEAETKDIGRDLAIWASLEGLHFSEAHCVSLLSEQDRLAVFADLRQRLAAH